MALNRRMFVTSSAVGAGALLLRAESASELQIDGARLRRDLEALSVFGRPSGGSFSSGVSRIGYSDADVAARRFAMQLMQHAGAKTRIDAAGNIFARRDGSAGRLPPVLFGSHIDSVPEGGNFDGDLGSMAAIEILQLLADKRFTTRRPLEAVIWACEEGTFNGRSLNGSRAAVGQMMQAELSERSNGMTKAEAIRRVGGDPEHFANARIHSGDYAAYVELHVEQGGTLDRAHIPIGVVDGIVTTDRYHVDVEGVANHAGATPMRDRHDALVSAAEVILAVRETVTSEPGAQVGTVGQMEVIPNAPNVVPGSVRMTIDLRDLSGEKIKRLAEVIRARTQDIAARTGTSISMTPAAHNEGALASPGIQTAIESAAKSLGLAYKHLPSAAGHDAQMLARVCPMGMIFVPSAGGVSHSPKEFTSWESCKNGADVLLRTVLLLAA